MRIEIIERGALRYPDFLALQRELFYEALLRKRNFLLFCSHQPVYTLGREAVFQEVLIPLNAAGIPMYSVRRGGKITYHDQGQLMVYPIVNIRSLFKGSIQQYTDTFKKMIAAALADSFVLMVDNKPDGLWIEGKKVVFMGLGFQQWISLHGFSILIDSDVSYFAKIRPCGRPIDVGNIKEFIGPGHSLKCINSTLNSYIIREVNKLF